MKNVKLNTAEDVANFLNDSPARKMQGICVDNDGKFHLFYTETFCFVLEEELYDEEECEE